jgi:small conductance mechanosensitive channel
MPQVQDLGRVLWSFLPLLVGVGLIAGVLASAHLLLRLRERRKRTLPLARHLIMLGITGLGTVVVVVALPVTDTIRGQLLGLLGIALTAVIAFSSTTFVANAMAALMVRAVGNFRPGDWIRVENEFGRVTERGLFHTEIQTEDRDLVTLPNLYLVTNPVQVVRSSGTIVSTELSLGYDVNHDQVERLLVDAVEAAGLEEPFVQLIELGDSSVTYRAAGFLAEVKHLLSVRSRLRASILDTLHEAGVEIVSPTFMNQRSLAEDVRFIPGRSRRQRPKAETPSPEEIMFDKADREASLELRREGERLRVEISKLDETAATAADDERRQIQAQIEQLRERADHIAAQLERAGAVEGEAGGPSE